MNYQPVNKGGTAGVLLLLFAGAVGGIAGCCYYGSMRYDYMIPTGMNGGAIGCGIFGAMSLFAFAYVFVAKTK
jgi:hypothetical protein